jgi:hypothetical protein
MTFMLSEDKALRQKLDGMEVFDQRANFEGSLRKVGVWFGMPDQEIRDQSYPYLTIDMVDVNRDMSREMRGVVDAPAYILANAVIPPNQGRQIDLPIPVNIDYQVTSYARHPRHDRDLMAQLLYTKFPLRAGVLDLDDGTSRRLDVLDIAKRDMVEQGKRLFMNAITVRVSSEIAQGTLKALYKVNRINISGFDTFTITI